MVEDKKIIVKQYSRKQLITLTICAAVILLSGIAIGVGTTILLAQNKFIMIGRPHKSSEQITQRIAERYDLTSQQTAQVRTLLNEMFEKEKSRRDEMDAKREADAEVMIAQMKVILTDEQFAMWNENFAKLREKFKKNR